MHAHLAPGSAPAGQTRRLVLRLVVAQVCIHACMTGFRMAAPLMALREGYSPLAVGLLVALFALSQVFLSLPAGRFVDRHGLHRPLAVGVCMAVAGGLLATGWPVFAALCVTALACGASSGLALIALQRTVGLLAQDATELKQVFSWLALGPAVSNFVGPLLAGVLIDASGFRTAYAVLAVLPVLAWFNVRRLALPSHTRPTPAAEPESSWTLLRQPAFSRLLALNWVLASCWDVHTFLVPVLGHERGISATAIGSVLGVFAVAATVVRVLTSQFAARLQEMKVVGGAMAVTAVLFAVYPMLGSAWSMGLASLGLGFALGSVQPMIMSTLHQLTPHHRHGEALALRAMAINASSVLMPLLFGSVGAAVGVGWVFWAVAGVVGAGAPLTWRGTWQVPPAD
jgi:predicted MFS family arabinose efflux permease